MRIAAFRPAAFLPAAFLCAAALLGGCAIPFKPGQTEAELLAAAGPPPGRYTLPGGIRRLE